ncbi:MAG: phosphate acyltransferase, partial [Candidatus Omnitrophota bacterium]
MSFLDQMREKAAKNLKTIVLPESDDPRTIEAVDYILDNGIAKLIVVGPAGVKDMIKSKNLKNLQIIDPATYKETESYANEYFELRKSKGMTIEEARESMLKEYVIFGGMLVRHGLAEGFVAGANHTTPDVIRAALRCLSIDKLIGVISGSFIMEVPDTPYGEKGVFLFADCGVNPDPNARQLAGIAVSSAQLFEKLVGVKARVAMLSYSSKGSAAGPKVDKVTEALAKAKEMAPDMYIDGEFQTDSAIVPEVAKLKCSESNVA